jgi:NAD(P)-dependent dehydrogenase (short-subunit alcohol dehydrogenase family)
MTMATTTDKAVLVTGASSGIGRATVAELARSGFLVFAGVRKDQDALQLRAEYPAEVVPLVMDVTNGRAIAVAADRVAERLGARGLDGLVNNAGIGISSPIEYVPLEELRYQFEVNVFGQIAVTQAFLPLLRRARGRVVNIGSVGAHITIPFGGLLCASKHALRSLNDALRLELHPFGIHVVIVEPGAIYTPGVEKTLGDAEETIRKLPAEGIARYGAMLREFMHRAYERERHGSAPDVVARAIHRALIAERPRIRYTVGDKSRLLAAMPRLLPDRVLDRIRFRLFGLSSRFGDALQGA